MEPEVLIVNLAYATYAATALCHRVRTLRSVLLASSLLFAAFGLVAGIYSVVAWNLGLALLNGLSLHGGSGTEHAHRHLFERHRGFGHQSCRTSAGS